MKIAIRSIAVVASFLLAASLAFVVSHKTLLPEMMRWLDVGTTPIRSDAAFVLLGDSDSRPFVAAALYKTGLVDEVLLARHQPSEVDPHEIRNDLVNKAILKSRGVPEEAIRLLGSGITNTMNESQALLEYLEQNPQATVSVVTSHFHTRRTRWSMQRNFGRQAGRLRYVSAPHRNFDENDWWLDHRGFQLIAMEHVKLLGYWVVYGNALYWCGGALTLAVAGVIVWVRSIRNEPTDEHAATSSGE